MKNKGGRPKWMPTEEEKRLIEQMASVGISHEQIAEVFGICVDTLVARMKDALRGRKVKANAKMAGRLYQAAMAGNVTAMIFWLKTQAGWRESADLKIEGDITQRVISAEPLTPEQWQKKYEPSDDGD